MMKKLLIWLLLGTILINFHPILHGMALLSCSSNTSPFLYAGISIMPDPTCNRIEGVKEWAIFMTKTFEDVKLYIKPELNPHWAGSAIAEKYSSVLLEKSESEKRFYKGYPVFISINEDDTCGNFYNKQGYNIEDGNYFSKNLIEDFKQAPLLKEPSLSYDRILSKLYRRQYAESNYRCPTHKYTFKLDYSCISKQDISCLLLALNKIMDKEPSRAIQKIYPVKPLKFLLTALLYFLIKKLPFITSNFHNLTNFEKSFNLKSTGIKIAVKDGQVNCHLLIEGTTLFIKIQKNSKPLQWYNSEDEGTLIQKILLEKSSQQNQALISLNHDTFGCLYDIKGRYLENPTGLSTLILREFLNTILERSQDYSKKIIKKAQNNYNPEKNAYTIISPQQIPQVLTALNSLASIRKRFIYCLNQTAAIDVTQFYDTYPEYIVTNCDLCIMKKEDNIRLYILSQSTVVDTSLIRKQMEKKSNYKKFFKAHLQWLRGKHILISLNENTWGQAYDENESLIEDATSYTASIIKNFFSNQLSLSEHTIQQYINTARLNLQDEIPHVITFIRTKDIDKFLKAVDSAKKIFNQRYN